MFLTILEMVGVGILSDRASFPVSLVVARGHANRTQLYRLSQMDADEYADGDSVYHWSCTFNQFIRNL